MFLCATSAQKDSNEPIDLTAALFQNQLDEPIKVKKFEIELVSSVIRKDNKITISAPNNLLLFRLGPIEAGEMYSAQVPPGIYTFSSLAIAIQDSLNDAVPCNAWRGWECEFDSSSGKFNIEFKTVLTPDLGSTELLEEDLLLTRGGLIENYNYDSGDEILSITPAYDDDVANGSVDVVENALVFGLDAEAAGASYFGMDIGNENVDKFFNTVTKDIGIFEGGGEVQYIIKPTEVFERSSIYSPATGEEVYLTLEADVEGTEYDPTTFGQSFIKDELLFHYTDDVGRVSNHSQKNGIFITPATNINNEKRGRPYTRGEFTLNFPPRNDTDLFDDRRKEFYKNTFNANMIFNVTDTQPLPNRAFTIQLHATPAETSTSTLKFLGQEREKLKFRLSTSPLVFGLQVKDDEAINLGNILQPPNEKVINGTKIRYIKGTIGRFNNRTFGVTALAGMTQGLLQKVGEPDIYKMPVYRIQDVNDDGEVQEIVLMDGGEHINLTSSAGPLVLNDPATFVIENLGSTTEEDIVTELCAFVDVDDADLLGNQRPFDEAELIHQYLPTEVGLVNDQIFQANQKGIDDLIGSVPPYPCNYSKDISVKVRPLSNNNTTEKFVEFEIRQFQPTTSAFADEGEITDFFSNFGGNRNYDVVLLKARPGTWNSLNYTTGSAPTNWTSDFEVNDESRIKITFKQKGIYQQEILCSFSKDSGATFQEEQLLMKTGDKVQGQIPSGPAFKKFEFTQKSRTFPLHLSISQYPKILEGSIIPDNEDTEITGRLTEYNSNNNYFQGDRIVKGINGNYNKNLQFLSLGATQPELMAPFPSSVDENHRPQIVLKTKTTGFEIVGNGEAYPLDAGQIRENEVRPNRGSLGADIGLHSVYTAEAGFTSPATFNGASAPIVIPELPSIAVEVNNIPIDGYIAKDYNVRDQQVGVGSRLPIVGIIPSLEDADVSNKAELHFRYNAPYSQPVICDLPTEQFLYNLSFRLREINTGKIVEGLKHPTELIFRVKNLDEKKIENNNM